MVLPDKLRKKSPASGLYITQCTPGIPPLKSCSFMMRLCSETICNWSEFGLSANRSQCTHIFLIRLKTPIFLCNTKLPFNSSAGVGEGWSAAHKNFRLLLLPSGPDKVHGISLRRTQTIPGEAIKGAIFNLSYILLYCFCEAMSRNVSWELFSSASKDTVLS